MYAVVKVNGHQYKVTPGNTITVDLVAGKVGEKVSFPALLVAENGKVKLGNEAAAVAVSAKIVTQDQGEKLHVRRFRAKSRTRRHTGFRSQLTKLSIEAIGDATVQSVKTTPTAPKPARSVRKKTATAL